MNIQLLTLLSTIVAIISGLISINDNLSKLKFTSILRVLSCYFLPVLFLQQIILFTYELLPCVYIFCVINGLIFFASYLIHKNNLTGCLNNDRKLILFFVVVSQLLFLVQPLYINCVISDYDITVYNFIVALKQYKICGDMYLYLANHLLVTFVILIDTIAVIFIVIMTFLAYDYFNSVLFNDYLPYDFETATNKILKVSLLTIIFSSGILKLVVKETLTLF